MKLIYSNKIFIYQKIQIIIVLLCPNLLWPHGLQPSRLACPWNFPGKNMGVGCHFLLQEIFQFRDQTHISCTDRWFFFFFNHWATWELISNSRGHWMNEHSPGVSTWPLHDRKETVERENEKKRMNVGLHSEVGRLYLDN